MSNRQSARVIELHGNDSKVPAADLEKRAEREIRPDPIAPKAPEWMTHPVARSTWRYLAAELERDALLTKRDRELFAMLCTSAAIAADAVRQLQPDRRKGFVLLEVDESHQGRTRRHPALMVWRGALEDFRKLSAHFGLSPRDRIPLEVGAVIPSAGDDGEDDEE